MAQMEAGCKWGRSENRYLEHITGNDVVYHCLGEGVNTGISVCDYLKKDEQYQAYFTIGYFCCFLLLRCSRTYIFGTRRDLPLHPGSVVQRLPDTPHTTRVSPDGQWLEFFISLGKPVYDCLRELGLIRPNPPVFAIQGGGALLHGFDRLLNRMKRAGNHLYPQLLPEAQKAVLSLHHSVPAESGGVHNAAVEKACAILGTAAGRFLPMEQVAKQVNLPYDTFRKAFSRITGKSPAAYRTDENMKQACMMLHTGLPIREIAAGLGYADIYSFTKQFTKSVGTSPGRYRQSGG
mgnify:CR=1 FL=1